MQAGVDYREEIVRAVSTCKVVICLMNTAWAKSGECLDEYSLAKRLNLTSKERGETNRTPIIFPIAFKDLQWAQHAHIKLLAATTNFYLLKGDIQEDASRIVEGVLAQLKGDYSVAAATNTGLTVEGKSENSLNSYVHSLSLLRSVHNN